MVFPKPPIFLGTEGVFFVDWLRELKTPRPNQSIQEKTLNLNQAFSDTSILSMVTSVYWTRYYYERTVIAAVKLF
jgi:hypothetical protein